MTSSWARSARNRFCSVSARWSCAAMPSNTRPRWANSSGPGHCVRRGIGQWRDGVASVP
jgi:hypothetical protein